MIEIYIAITQKQIKNFESIISHDSENDKKTAYKILIRDSSFNYNVSLWDQVITSEVLFQKKSGKKLEDFLYMFKKIDAYKKIINKLAAYKNINEVRIFVCYIEDVLSNHLFFNFNKQADIIVIEDGVLNYYNHNFDNVNKIRFFLKKIISFFYGINVIIYKGHSSGIEYTKVSKQYLTFPNLAFVPVNTYKLPKSNIFIPNISKSLFIVGQETYIELLGKEEYFKQFELFINALFEKIKAKEIVKVYYKPRYKVFNHEIMILNYYFKKENVEIITDQLSSEEIYFLNLHSRYIASFSSSTMINIFAQLTEIQNNEISFYFYSIRDSELIHLFKRLGFQNLNK